MGSHEELGLGYPCGFRGRLLARVMAVVDVGSQRRTGDRMYENMVRRYRVCVEVAGRHIEPFL